MTQKLRVLLVDDTVEIRALLRATLERDGRFAIVGEAADGATGVEMAWRERPDAVVIDLAMPVMDGLQAIPEIRRVHPATRILVLSGFNAAQMSAEALNRGADAYLRKGVAFAQLAEVLADLCRPQDAVAADAAALETAPTNHAPEGEPAPARLAPGATNGDDPFATLVSRVVHDLLTPVTVIQGFAATLRESIAQMDAGSIAMCAEAIERRAHGLTEQIRGFADARDLQRGTFRVEPETLAADDAVRRVLRDLASVTAGRQVTLALEHVIAPLDRARFEQLVAALVTNAVKFTPPGSPIEVILRRTATGVELSVSDDGPGIAPEHAEEIFAPFARLDPSVPGSGLGLAIARGVARAHGGELTVSSGPGCGARFTFAMPLRAGLRVVGGSRAAVN